MDTPINESRQANGFKRGSASQEDLFHQITLALSELGDLYQEADVRAPTLRSEIEGMIEGLNSEADRTYLNLRLGTYREPVKTCHTCGKSFPVTHLVHQHPKECPSRASNREVLKVFILPEDHKKKEMAKALGFLCALERAAWAGNYGEAAKLNRRLIRLEGFIESEKWVQHIAPRIARACGLMWGVEL